MKEMVRRGLFLALTTTLWACGGGTDDVDPQQAVEDDIAQYESLQKELEATREEFIKTRAQDSPHRECIPINGRWRLTGRLGKNTTANHLGFAGIPKPPCQHPFAFA